jgi:hypothetical protein
MSPCRFEFLDVLTSPRFIHQLGKKPHILKPR